MSTDGMGVKEGIKGQLNSSIQRCIHPSADLKKHQNIMRQATLLRLLYYFVNI